MSPTLLLLIFGAELLLITGFLLYFRRKVYWQILGPNKSTHKKLHGYYVRYWGMVVAAVAVFTFRFLQ